MKQTPEQHAVLNEMSEGRISRQGFLGSDDRSLNQIVTDDANTLETLGTDASNLVKAMRTLTRVGLQGLEKPEIYDGYEVEVIEFMGILACPYGDTKGSAKRNTKVTHLKSGKHFSWTDLGMHLIEDHGFFQGKGSPYRLEPEELVAFLRLDGTHLLPDKRENETYSV